jgi:hypothetical protein
VRRIPSSAAAKLQAEALRVAAKVVKGDVVKIDVQRDLALIRPRSFPNRFVRPLEISTQDIEVGADVHDALAALFCTSGREAPSARR